MNDKLQKAYILADKVYTGQATKEEALHLAEWKAESLHNTKLHNEIVQLLDIISKLKDWKQFDNNKAWTSFKNRTNAQKLSISYKKILSIAAIFLLVLAATIWNFGSNFGASDGKFISGSNNAFSILQDGSELFLSDNAQIDIASFSKDERVIRSEGDYFVNVAHNKDLPFKIETENTNIEVLGTSFKVEEREEITTIKVRDGKVRITVDTGVSYLLEKNEMFVFNAGNVNISKLQNHDWGLINESFNDESMFKLLNYLSEHYENFKFSSSGIRNECRITTKIDQSTIIEIIEELSLIFTIDYTIKDGTIIVHSVIC